MEIMRVLTGVSDESCFGVVCDRVNRTASQWAAVGVVIQSESAVVKPSQSRCSRSLVRLADNLLAVPATGGATGSEWMCAIPREAEFNAASISFDCLPISLFDNCLQQGGF